MPTATRRARVLEFDGTQRDISRDATLAEVRRGGIVVVDGLLDELGHLDPIRDLYIDGIASVASRAAADEVRRRGLERLHEVVEAPEVATLIVTLDRGPARRFILPVAQGITSAISGGHPGRYWICDRMWIRAQLPYAHVARHPEVAAAGHLMGHLSPTDAHRDFWLTHPKGTLSYWAAVGPITRGNTVALFDDDDLDSRDTDTSGLRSVLPELAPGDVVVFDADRLHASVRNETEHTRVSIGARILPARRLQYGDGVHWRPFHDARLVGTPLDRLSTARSRATLAALRRARWRRQWNRGGGAQVPRRARG
jgi:hypothetical protein